MPSRLPRLAIGRRPIQPRQAEPRARRALERAAAPRFAAFDSRAGRRIAPEWRHPSRKATVSPSPSPPTQRRRRRSDPASVRRCRAMPTTSGGRRLRAKSDGPGPQSLRVCRCPPGSRSRERTLRSESQMAVLSIELPESVLGRSRRTRRRACARASHGRARRRPLARREAGGRLPRPQHQRLEYAHGRRQLPAEQEAPRPQALVPAFAARPLAFWSRTGAIASKSLPRSAL